ncbi:hypothetical protein Trydic_g2775 [Trypoxylus dichotomus]
MVCLFFNFLIASNTLHSSNEVMSINKLLLLIIDIVDVVDEEEYADWNYFWKPFTIDTDVQSVTPSSFFMLLGTLRLRLFEDANDQNDRGLFLI